MQDRILYDSKDRDYKSPFGCIKENEECKISIDVPKSCPVIKIFLVLSREDGLNLTVPLVKRADEKAKFEWDDRYSCSFSLYSPGLYFYYFKFQTEISEFSLYKWGCGDTNIEQGDLWQLTCLEKNYSVPSWVQGRVMYQIFPDRFAKSGSPNLNGKLGPYSIHESTSEKPFIGADSNGNWNTDFYGGNLKGITEKLDYLMSLGVGVIYLNPIFKAFSNHRYDTADYKKIDPMLGNEEDLKELCQKARERGIAIILDGVFSHVGKRSIYFDDDISGEKKGAVNDPKSKYCSWFRFSSYPSCYESWWGIDTLPCVDELCPSYVDYIVRDSDSVIAHWLKIGVSGFRLDVADELPDEFISLLRKRVKEINSEAVVIGEVWEDASNKCAYSIRRKYFSGSELDGVMNYPFRKLIIELVTGVISQRDFISGVMTIYENYPREALNCCMTFLSTHDTPRIKTVLCDVVGEELLGNVLETAVTLQYFLPGMPCVYYGDEVGMTGGKDPENRGWYSEVCPEMRALYKKLGDYRKASKALRYGDLEMSEENGVLTITRSCQGDRITLAIMHNEKGFCLEIK